MRETHSWSYNNDIMLPVDRGPSKSQGVGIPIFPVKMKEAQRRSTAAFNIDDFKRLLYC